MTSPKLAKTSRSGRIYKHPITGAEYPSVTTVLGIVGKGEALKHWAANEVAKYAVKNRETWTRLDEAAAIDLLKREPLRFLDRAASRGTDVHALAEAYAKTGSMPQWADEISGYVDALRRFFDEHQPRPVLVEYTVFNNDIGYAGSFDMVCQLDAFDGVNVMLDYKTSKAIYPDVAAQLAAYANGNEYIDDNNTPQPMPKIEKAVAVRLAADGTYQMVECDIEAGWRYFQAVRKVHDIPTKPLLLGDVQPPLARIADNRNTLRDRLIARIAWLKENNSAAFAAFVATWTPDLPTFKSGHQHSSVELARIERMLNETEREHNIPFHAAVTARDEQPTAVAPKTPTADNAPATMPSDEITVDQAEVDKVRTRLNSTDDKTRETVKKIAQQANRAKRNISLNGKPSLRRVLLADMLINTIEQDGGETNLVEAMLRKLEARSERTLGYDIGTLDIDKITKMSELLAAIRSGSAAMQYNTNQDTFDIVEQEGQQ
jgi:hypothetical protein